MLLKYARQHSQSINKCKIINWLRNTVHDAASKRGVRQFEKAFEQISRPEDKYCKMADVLEMSITADMNPKSRV